MGQRIDGALCVSASMPCRGSTGVGWACDGMHRWRFELDLGSGELGLGTRDKKKVLRFESMNLNCERSLISILVIGCDLV